MKEKYFSLVGIQFFPKFCYLATIFLSEMNSMQYFLETHRPEFPMKITTKRHVISEKCAKNTKNCFCMNVGLLQKRDSPPKSGPISIGKPSVAREMSQTLTTYSLCPIR